MLKEGPGRLDKKRPYGEVYGQGQVRYEQDHKQFDARGHELVPEGKKKAKPPQPAAAPDRESDEATESEPSPDREPDELDNMTMSQLRARYTEITGGQKAKVGLNKAAIADLIRKAAA